MAEAQATPPCRRLMIRQMVLDNFKSYAGTQSVGPFHKSFSSVVGPNGSGKSNVIDAMLFVFGRRAKQLRFNKVSELIHNSTNFQNLEMAKVTVYFQEIIDKEGDDYDVVPNTEFTVARTAHRNNTSDYYINNRKVSSKEVTDKLKSMGIDLDNNRFLILQGEVEQISMMKPKGEDKNDTGLLEYLEDIIGTHVYVEQIEQAGKQLEEANEKRHGLIQRLKIAEAEKDGLEGKKAEAEMFLTKQAEMLQARICGTTIYITQTNQNLSKMAAQEKEFESKLTYEREKAAAQGQEFKSAEKAYESAEKETRACQQALETAEAEFKGFERRDAKGQIELKDMAEKIKKLVAKIDKDAAAVKRAEAEVISLQEEGPVVAQKLAALQQDLVAAEAALEAEHEGLRGEVEGYHQQLSQVRTELAPWEKKVGEATGRIAIATTERDTMARRADDARKRLDGALKSLATAQQGAAAREKHIRELEANIVKCKSEIEGHKRELAASRAEEARLEGCSRELRERLAGLRADTQSGTNASALMVNLMTARAKGELTGLYGRLGDLGAIDPKYDVAVSTAVGALDYIVVETTSDAQRCVEYLRKNNLGVATCLILEKQKHLSSVASKKIDTPEGCPRLFDLIKVNDEALLPAFYFAFGNTLVADNLDQASRIAYGKDPRFKRVVTLQGQLIAESGTMSGGAGRPSRGRMALGKAAPKGTATGATDAKAAVEELKAAERTLAETTSALNSARDRSEACEKAVKAAEKQLADLELAAPKARMEAQAEADKAVDIEQRLESLKAATQMDSEEGARIAALSSDIAREEANVAKLKQQMKGLERQAMDIQAKIDHAGGERLQSVKTKVSKLQKDISDAEADASKKAVQLKACLKLISNSAKDKEKDDKSKTRLESEAARSQQELKDMEEQALKVMTLREETRAQLTLKTQELEATRKTLREVADRHAIIRKTENEIEAALAEIAKIRKEESTKVHKWQREIEKLHHDVQQLTGGDVVMVDAASLEGQDADEHMFKAGAIEAELAKMEPDMDAIEQWRVKAVEHANRAAQLDTATKERDEVRMRFETLRKARLDEFMAGFNIISLKLKEMYQMITLGGDAELELVDSLDPFTEGIVFSVRPPKKSWKNISNLSGGEKTLSSLSLVFALHHYKPTPLYVMDEIDAALDFKNVSIVAHYIKERTRNAQFVIISLRNNMFELADRLVGIYKTDNTTKTVTINPGTFVVKPAMA